MHNNRGSYSFNGSSSKATRSGDPGVGTRPMDTVGTSLSEPPTPSLQVKLSPSTTHRRVPSTGHLMTSLDVKYNVTLNNNNTSENSRNTNNPPVSIKSSGNGLGCSSTDDEISQRSTGSGNQSSATGYRLGAFIPPLMLGDGKPAVANHQVGRVGRSLSSFQPLSTRTSAGPESEGKDTFGRTSFCDNIPPTVSSTDCVSEAHFTSEGRSKATRSLTTNNNGNNRGIIPRSLTNECFISTDFTSSNNGQNNCRPSESIKFKTIPRFHSKFENDNGSSHRSTETNRIESLMSLKNQMMHDVKCTKKICGSGTACSSRTCHSDKKKKYPETEQINHLRFSSSATNLDTLYCPVSILGSPRVGGPTSNGGKTSPRNLSGLKDDTLHEDVESNHPFFTRMRDSSDDLAIMSSKGTVRGVRNRVKAGIAVFVDKLDGKKSKDYRTLEKDCLVLYTTSMKVIRETHDKCLCVKKILQTHRVVYEERDIFLSKEFHRELVERLNEEQIILPQVFADGVHLGGATEMERLNEQGVLREIFKHFKKVKGNIACCKCGGYLYVPCVSCHGSKKSHRNTFTEEFCALRCTLCDESGLVRCDFCNISNNNNNGNIGDCGTVQGNGVVKMNGNNNSCSDSCSVVNDLSEDMQRSKV